MCILLKLHYAKFDVSRLFCSNVIEEKPLGVGSTPSPLVKEGLKNIVTNTSIFKKYIKNMVTSISIFKKYILKN